MSKTRPSPAQGEKAGLITGDGDNCALTFERKEQLSLSPQDCFLRSRKSSDSSLFGRPEKSLSSPSARALGLFLLFLPHARACMSLCARADTQVLPLSYDYDNNAPSSSFFFFLAKGAGESDSGSLPESRGVRTSQEVN